MIDNEKAVATKGPVCALLTALCILFVQTVYSASHSSEDFARLPEFSNFKLSPSGRYVAVSATIDGKRYLVTRGISGGKPGILSGGTFFFHDYVWASDERLIVTIRATDNLRGNLLNVNRLISFSRDFNDIVPLKGSPNSWGYYRQNPRIVSLLKSDPEHILAELDDEESGWATPEVDRVNIYTGRKTRVQKNRREILQWIADADGQLRVGYSINKTATGGRGRSSAIYYRESEEHAWETIQEVDYLDKSVLLPDSFHEQDRNILLVRRQADESGSEADDVPALFRYDLKKRALAGPHQDDKRDAVLQRARRQFPGTRIEISSSDSNRKNHIIRRFSDVIPSEYYLYNVPQDRFSLLGKSYPQLGSDALSSMKLVSYTARDGREIPAYLTIPRDLAAENLPVIVFPHGGPWARDYWGFNNYVQFLASRGYAVLQPQFRGSTGFGKAHEEAGYGEWGYAIQDDITDGTLWLIDQQIADPARICIAGASFGGYAAAMGVASTPELFRCAIAINGVHDLKTFIDSGRRLLFADINRAMWNERSSATDASPYHQQKNIQAPVLIIASEKDTVVPYKDHSRKLYRKLKKRKHDVEYLLLEDGEHWNTNEAHQLEIFQAIEQFLDKHLAETAPPRLAGRQ